MLRMFNLEGFFLEVDKSWRTLCQPQIMSCFFLMKQKIVYLQKWKFLNTKYENVSKFFFHLFSFLMPHEFNVSLGDRPLS